MKIAVNCCMAAGFGGIYAFGHRQPSLAYGCTSPRDLRRVPCLQGPWKNSCLSRSLLSPSTTEQTATKLERARKHMCWTREPQLLSGSCGKQTNQSLLQDETTRKYVQMVKRLVTFADTWRVSMCTDRPRRDEEMEPRELQQRVKVHFAGASTLAGAQCCVQLNLQRKATSQGTDIDSTLLGRCCFLPTL